MKYQFDGCDSPNGDITSQAEIFGLEDLVCTWVVENSLGMDAGLVREGTVPTTTIYQRPVRMDHQ